MPRTQVSFLRLYKAITKYKWYVPTAFLFCDYIKPSQNTSDMFLQRTATSVRTVTPPFVIGPKNFLVAPFLIPFLAAGSWEKAIFRLFLFCDSFSTMQETILIKWSFYFGGGSKSNHGRNSISFLHNFKTSKQ